MAFMDQLKGNIGTNTDNNDGVANAKSSKIVLSNIPTNLAQLQAADGADLKDPAKVAALAVAVLCIYPLNKDICIEMINYLKGPQPLSAYDKQFLADRMRNKGEYLAASYFEGATPNNNYEPSQPYTINIYETAHSRDAIGEGYLQLFVKSGGADTARGIKLRTKPSTGQWFLWDYLILSDIRKPVKDDAWA